jgi:hypothetical protein
MVTFSAKVKYDNIAYNSALWVPETKKSTALRANISILPGTNNIQEDVRPWALNPGKFPLK